MARARYQVLVLPFRAGPRGIEYCIFHRADIEMWQFIAGGGEDEETPLQAAKREAFEEAGLLPELMYYPLETCCSIPTECFGKYRRLWGERVLVIPEYTFAVNAADTKFNLSLEHTRCEWVCYDTAMERLRYDSNKTALWELDSKIKASFL